MELVWTTDRVDFRLAKPNRSRRPYPLLRFKTWIQGTWLDSPPSNMRFSKQLGEECICHMYYSVIWIKRLSSSVQSYCLGESAGRIFFLLPPASEEKRIYLVIVANIWENIAGRLKRNIQAHSLFQWTSRKRSCRWLCAFGRLLSKTRKIGTTKMQPHDSKTKQSFITLLLIILVNERNFACARLVFWAQAVSTDIESIENSHSMYNITLIFFQI